MWKRQAEHGLMAVISIPPPTADASTSPGTYSGRAMGGLVVYCRCVCTVDHPYLWLPVSSCL